MASSDYSLHKSIKYNEALSIISNISEDERSQINCLNFKDPSDEALSEQYTNLEGLKYTLYYKETPVLIGGFYFIRTTVLETFMLVKEESWSLHGKVITKITKTILDDIYKRFQLRIQTIVLSSRNEAKRWYKVIGLKEESCMESLGRNKENFNMFTKTEGG